MKQAAYMTAQWLIIGLSLIIACGDFEFWVLWVLRNSTRRRNSPHCPVGPGPEGLPCPCTCTACAARKADQSLAALCQLHGAVACSKVQGRLISSSPHLHSTAMRVVSCLHRAELTSGEHQHAQNCQTSVFRTDEIGVGTVGVGTVAVAER
jgi:hypothetical protein